jgi:hypothetical protein
MIFLFLFQSRRVISFFLSSVFWCRFAMSSFSFFFEFRKFYVVEILLKRNLMSHLLFNSLLKKKMMMNSLTKTIMNFQIALNIIAFRCFVIIWSISRMQNALNKNKFTFQYIFDLSFLKFFFNNIKFLFDLKMRSSN